jgi:hypothetical protein
MAYLIIILVMLLVLSPVFWMMPSPKQKRQMQLRQRAMALGFQVKICDLPQTHVAMIRKEPPEQGVVYRLLWRDKKQNTDNFHYIILRDQGEEGQTDLPTAIASLLLELLVSMPDQVVGLEYASSGVALYWRERGGVEQVDHLYQQIMSLQVGLIELEKSTR